MAKILQTPADEANAVEKYQNLIDNTNELMLP
jgi:hypothetical protein